jgi:potassium-dependent mechanosensitive channel
MSPDLARMRYLIPLLAFACAAPLSAQQPGPPPAQAAAPAPEHAETPQVYEVAGRAGVVQDSALQAERLVARLREAGDFTGQVEEAQRRHQDLQLLLATLLESDYIRPERFSRVRDQALLEDQRLATLRDEIISYLQQLGALRSEWLQRQRTWREWRSQLRADPDFDLAAPDIARTISRADSIVQSASAAMTALLSRQREVEALRAENEAVARTLADVRATRREALFQRGEPVLLSPDHLSQLRAGDAAAWVPVAALNPAAYVNFLRGHGGLLFFHVMLAVLLALAARRLRRLAREDEPWFGILAQPWALGAIISVAVAMQRVTLAPPLWDVLLWGVFAASAAVLARPLFPTRALRLTVYLLAVFYPLFLLLEVGGLATPVFRLVIAAVAGAALPVFMAQARRRTAVAAAEGSRDPRRIWPLRIGAAMWAAVLLSIILGFDLLGRWVLHATVTSGAVVFVTVLVVAILQGALATLLRAEAQRRFLRSIAVPFARRFMALLQAVLIVAVLLIIADVWELAPSPLVSWQLIVGTGFSIGDVRITIGRILVAGALLYLAMVASWLIRSFLQSEAYRRWNFDRGVGDSINMLVHYTLVLIGVFMALAALGVQLQNFAIVAGALGIGIGFGLQNVVNNFASGLILLFERPVRVGDTVVVGGEWGTIRKIGLRSTIMMTFDQSEMIVPNADLVSEKVVNWTLSNPVARVIIEVGAAYGSDVAGVLQILRESGPAHEAVLPDPSPQALFTGFGESSLDFELRVWVREIRLRLEVRSALLAEIDRRFAEAGIEIPFPQRDLHIRSVDPAASEALRR